MFVHTIRPSHLKTAVTGIAALLLCTALLCFPQTVHSGIRYGLSLCSNVLIPGLFPFLALSDFSVKSGLCTSLGKWLQTPVSRLFYLPGCCASAILIGLIGGYPAGALTAGELYRQGHISAAEARRLLRFCVNAGPAFIISTVGVGLLGSVRTGLLLYAAHVAAALLIGIADGLCERFFRKTPPPTTVNHTTAMPLPLGVALPRSVTAACTTLLSMCGFVLLASTLLTLLTHLGIPPHTPLGEFLAGLLEVSCGCVAVANTTAMPLLLGTVLGWGGLSVHGQLAAALADTPLLRGDFFAARILHALLGGILTALLFRLIPWSNAVLLPLNETLSPALSGNTAAGAALLFTCGLFLLTVKHEPAP